MMGKYSAIYLCEREREREKLRFLQEEKERFYKKNKLK